MGKDKIFIDLFYVTFSFKKPEEVLKRCYSTVGYLEKLAISFNLYFVARTTEYSSFSEDKPLKAFLFKGKKLKKWMIPFRFNWFIKSLQPDYILVHGFGFVHYLVFLKMILPKSKILLQSNGFAPKPKGIKNIFIKFRIISLMVTYLQVSKMQSLGMKIKSLQRIKFSLSWKVRLILNFPAMKSVSQIVFFGLEDWMPIKTH